MIIPYLDLESRHTIKELFSFSGKTILVTAAAGQIGYMSAAGFAELGADVVISDLEQTSKVCEKHAEEISKKYGVKCVFIPADVTKKSEIEDLFKEIRKMFGKLDAVHSNTGVSFSNDNGEVSLEIWKKTFEINTAGTLLINQEACKLMRESRIKGSIVNTASMSASVINRVSDSFAHEIAYPASKAALLHLTKGLAMEYIKYGIRVNAVSPGYVYSATHEKSSAEKIKQCIENIPMKRFARADEITGAVLYLCSDLSSYVTGSEVLVDGGYSVW